MNVFGLVIHCVLGTTIDSLNKFTWNALYQDVRRRNMNNILGNNMWSQTISERYSDQGTKVNWKPEETKIKI